MADFAPTYMDVYDKDQSEITVLVDITINTDEVEEGSATGTVIGALSGKSTDGVLSLPYEQTGNANFAISGSNLVVGPNGDSLTPGDYPVVVLETNQYATTQTRATTLTVTVTPAA